MNVVDFAATAEKQLSIQLSAIDVFSASHDLSFIYSPHAWHTQAEAAVGQIGPGTYVGVEKTSFNRQELRRTFDDCLDTIPRGETIDDFTPAFLYRFWGSLACSGLQLFELRQRNETRFNLYKERAYEELDSINGILGTNPIAGYTLKLIIGVLEQDCVYGPADADSRQLPAELADSIRLLGMNSVVENGPDRPALWQNMHHYRDRALVYNLVTDSLAGYRQALGVPEDTRLPVKVVRGSGHRNSVGAILGSYGIEHKYLLFAAKGAVEQEELLVPDHFMPLGEPADPGGQTQRVCRRGLLSLWR